MKPTFHPNNTLTGRAQQAAVEVEELLFRGHREVVDADLADFFGSIPHTELMKSVARRVVDRRRLILIQFAALSLSLAAALSPSGLSLLLAFGMNTLVIGSGW